MNRCSLCPKVNNLVPASGPSLCSILFIGEAPGRDENIKQIPFVGKVGREVNEHYLPLAGLRRDHCRFTNAILCLPDRPKGRVDLGRGADKELLLSCSGHHLTSEIETCSPRVIVTMGMLAAYAIDPEINLEFQHGIPLETKYGTVFPMYHPAGGLHEPKKILLIRNDWVRLGKFLKGKLAIQADRFPRPRYSQITGSEIFESYLECNDYTQPLSIDTEINRFHKPFCLTFSDQPGTGKLILATDTEALEVFDALIGMWQGPIIFHNYLGVDEWACRDMGLTIPWRKVVDTMVRAYHLGNLPQGLKALAYRLLGMEMEDFDGVVTPYSFPLCLNYLCQAASINWPKPEEDLVRDVEGNWKLYKPQSMTTKLKRFFTDLDNNPTMDIFERWANWESAHEMIQAKLGPWPGKCISYVPFEKALHYACRDADATLRLWEVEKVMTRQVRRKLQEHWGDI